MPISLTPYIKQKSQINSDLNSNKKKNYFMINTSVIDKIDKYPSLYDRDRNCYWPTTVK